MADLLKDLQMHAFKRKGNFKDIVVKAKSEMFKTSSGSRFHFLFLLSVAHVNKRDDVFVSNS